MIGGRLYSDRTTLIKGGYVLTLDPELGDELGHGEPARVQLTQALRGLVHGPSDGGGVSRHRVLQQGIATGIRPFVATRYCISV